MIILGALVIVWYYVNKNIMSIEALTAQVEGLNSQVVKIQGEIQGLIDVIDAMDEVPAELQAAVDALAANIQVADDLVEDEVVEEPGEGEEGV